MNSVLENYLPSIIYPNKPGPVYTERLPPDSTPMNNFDPDLDPDLDGVGAPEAQDQEESEYAADGGSVTISIGPIKMRTEEVEGGPPREVEDDTDGPSQRSVKLERFTSRRLGMNTV
jgi:hypothetical protein